MMRTVSQEYGRGAVALGIVIHRFCLVDAPLYTKTRSLQVTRPVSPSHAREPRSALTTGVRNGQAPNPSNFFLHIGESNYKKINSYRSASCETTAGDPSWMSDTSMLIYRRALLWQGKRPFRSFCLCRQDAIVLFLRLAESMDVVVHDSTGIVGVLIFGV